MNRIDELFSRQKARVLSVYATAGFPALESTAAVLHALQDAGADMIELGMPYSDPLADGPVIQAANMKAIENGMTLEVLFEQIKDMRPGIRLPVLLMGYLNPVMQYGFERFCADAARAGVDGIILPDLPMREYTASYASVLQRHGLYFVFLVTPETSDERVHQLDSLSSGFLYAVSSSSTTGKDKQFGDQQAYFSRLRELHLRNRVLVGFGIKDKPTFDAACAHTSGAIIGTAYIRALEAATSVPDVTRAFIHQVRP